MNTIKKADIIIVGAGLAGLALASLLAKKTTLSILLLEANKDSPHWRKEQYEVRVSAITLASAQLLQAIEVWQTILDLRSAAFNGIEVYVGDKQLNFNAHEINSAHLGFIIENNLIKKVLQEKIKTFPQIECCYGVNLKHFIADDDTRLLIDTQDQQYHAKLIIAADGAHSWLRSAANIKIAKKDYQQDAIIANVQMSKPHQALARQVFLPPGPLAFLPLQAADTCSIVWSVPKTQCTALLQLTEQDFKTELANQFGWRLGEVVSITKLYHFPLIKLEAENYVQNGVVLVGDAAHVIHPLAGQGINIGFSDVLSLTNILSAAISANKDFADQKVLRTYARACRAKNFPMLFGVDFLQSCFQNNNRFFSAMRSVGLTFTQFPWVRNFITRYASGQFP